MSYFNQQKFSESVSDDTENVEKGHKNKMKIDIAKFDELCKKFREKKDLKIKKLSGTDKEDFNLAVSYVHLVYGTSYYSHLYDKVRKYFGNVVSVKHGTVGAYFAGCLISSKEKSEGSFMSAGCNISCAGSMPLPKDEEGWSFCDKAVIMAEKSGEGYNFSMIKPANTEEEIDPAYLFVEAKSFQDFSGFSKEEKEQILAYGCKKVKLVGYSSDMSYSDIYTESKSISEIKHRYKRRKNNNNQTNNWWWIVIIIIVLILLCIAAGYQSFKNKRYH